MTPENDALETKTDDRELLEGIDDHQQEQSNKPTDEAKASDDETKDEAGQDEAGEDDVSEAESSASSRDAGIPWARFHDVNALLQAGREETAWQRAGLAALQEQPQQSGLSLNELEDQ